MLRGSKLATTCTERPHSMTEVYLLKNHQGFYLNKQQDWVDGTDAASLYRTEHKDEAINTKVELTVKAPDLRIVIVDCALNERGQPCVTIDAPQLAQIQAETE